VHGRTRPRPEPAGRQPGGSLQTTALSKIKPGGNAPPGRLGDRRPKNYRAMPHGTSIWSRNGPLLTFQGGHRLLRTQQLGLASPQFPATRLSSSDRGMFTTTDRLRLLPGSGTNGLLTPDAC
jgi:hypothetical protein